MSKKRIFGGILLLAIFIAGILFLFYQKDSNHSDSGKEVVRIVYLPIAPDLPFFVAMDQGFFSKQDLKVDPVLSKKSDEALDLFFTGRVDATAIMELYGLISYQQVKPGTFKIYLMAAAEENTEVHKIIVRKGSSINSLEQLSGGKLGHFPGTQMKVFNVLLLKQFIDDPEKEVSLVNVVPFNQIPFLESGSIDAVFTLEPVGTEAVEKGIAEILSVNPLYKYIQQPFPTAASAISKELVEKRPETAKKIIAAIEEAIEFIENNPVEAKHSLIKWTKVSPEIVEKVGIYRYWTLSRINKFAVNRYVDLLYANGLLDQKINTSAMYYEK